ncbi:NDR1/HIN1-like protein 6 [Senna tora]|uniref:NDR1/HIN1-like protein 6 n=1 Tax=Senna tora TaxID=362788 RepID=A0A834TZ19_9FABA|nr:NDR1/HIN1-like protein 6 [Senna tora]
MADHNQRIHPLTTDDDDAEAPPPTAPLFPRNTSKSDVKPDGIDPPATADPPLPRRTFPVSHSPPPRPPKRRRRSCLCKLLCWTLTLLLTLIVALAITLAILYLIFKPKLPKFSIQKLRVTQFNLTGSDDLSAAFSVGITAVNPNTKIGIYYEGGSHVEAWYEDTKLCEGSLPRFYQGHRNTTSLELPMSGRARNASGLMTDLQEEEKERGNVGLDLKVKQPVRVKLGRVKMFKVRFRVRCRLLVDSISAGNDIGIQSSSCKFRFRL